MFGDVEESLEIPEAMCVQCVHSFMSLYPLFVYLPLSVPAVPQFDPGFGGIVSNRQRVGKEV